MVSVNFMQSIVKHVSYRRRMVDLLFNFVSESTIPLQHVHLSGGRQGHVRLATFICMIMRCKFTSSHFLRWAQKHDTWLNSLRSHWPYTSTLTQHQERKGHKKINERKVCQLFNSISIQGLIILYWFQNQTKPYDKLPYFLIYIHMEANKILV